MQERNAMVEEGRREGVGGVCVGGGTKRVKGNIARKQGEHWGGSLITHRNATCSNKKSR